MNPQLSPRLRLVPRTGLGALTDTALISAAQGLLQYLQSSGVPSDATQAVPQVTAFESAYNTAGGTPPLPTQGLYGPATQQALQSVIAANTGTTFALTTAPTATITSAQETVAPATNAPASSGAPTTTNVPSTTTTTTTAASATPVATTPVNYTPWITGGAIVIAGGLVALAIHAAASPKPKKLGRR